jgi:hypothetical protein
MPDESCRSCGGELVNHRLCSDCRKAIQKKCKFCNNSTFLQSHLYCMNNLTSNQKLPLVQAIQKNKPSKTRNNSLRFSLFTIGIVGFFILGLVTLSYPGITQGIRDEAQATNSDNISVKITDSFPAKYGKLYSNCIAYGSGGSITVTCPTDNGTVYREILIMPQDLKKEFSNSVFSIRGISLMENSDGSVMLQYHLKDFLTRSFGT